MAAELKRRSTKAQRYRSSWDSGRNIKPSISIGRSTIFISCVFGSRVELHKEKFARARTRSSEAEKKKKKRGASNGFHSTFSCPFLRGNPYYPKEDMAVMMAQVDFRITRFTTGIECCLESVSSSSIPPFMNLILYLSTYSTSIYFSLQ